MQGCEAVVHAGAIAHDSAGTPAEIVATNVLGTWHVLQAAKTHSISRQILGWEPSRGWPSRGPVSGTGQVGPGC